MTRAAVFEEFVVFLTYSGDLFCLEASTGRRLWGRILKLDPQGLYATPTGQPGPMANVAGGVAVDDGGQLVLLNLAKGYEILRRDLGGARIRSLAAHETRLYVVTDDKTHAFDLRR